MPLTKDDLDAVSMTLLVNGEQVFRIYLTRGGLTQRMGSSDPIDPAALLIKGGTDAFEPFLAALPETLLSQEGGVLDDGGSGTPRHEWRFELGGGMNSLIYDVSYDPRSASLPDEFADMVVLAERLTHSWYVAMVTEETGAPGAAEPVPPAPTPKKASAAVPTKAGAGRARAPSSGHATTGRFVPASRERLALAMLLDFLAWTLPFSFLAWLFVGGAERTGPPGAGLVLFAIVEFVLLMIVRRSPGLWALGMTVPAGAKPQVDASWPTRESKVTLGVGTGMCALGVVGLTSWTLYHTAVPWFGLAFPLWLSVPLALLLSVALIVAGGLLLRLDMRGIWLGGGVASVLLLAGVLGRDDWGGFVTAALANRSAYEGRPVGEGLLGLLGGLVPILVVAAPVLLGLGIFYSWKRLARPLAAVPKARAARS